MTPEDEEPPTADRLEQQQDAWPATNDDEPFAPDPEREVRLPDDPEP